MGDQAESNFKVCSMCGKVWRDRSEFLADPAVRAIGYMPNFHELELGLFFFNHETTKCYTTLVISAGQFTDLYDGPVYTERLIDTAECPGYCLHKDELRPCPARCECSYVREVLNQVTRWKKAGMT